MPTALRAGAAAVAAAAKASEGREERLRHLVVVMPLAERSLDAVLRNEGIAGRDITALQTIARQLCACMSERFPCSFQLSVA